MKQTFKKLFGTLLASVLLIGSMQVKAQAQENTTTFVFIAPEGAMEKNIFNIINYKTYELTENKDIVDNKFIVQYDSDQSWRFSVFNPGYEMTIEAPEELKKYSDYNINYVTGEAGASDITVWLSKACYGYEFICTITPVADESTVNFQFDASAEDLAKLTVRDFALPYPDFYIQDQISDNKLAVSYIAYDKFAFQMPKGYVVEIVPPANLTADVDYVITEGTYNSDYELYETSIQVYSGCDGETFTVDISADSKGGVYDINDLNDGIYKVYNMNGVEVLSTRDSSELKNLVPGIYIVNGKKMIKK